MSLSVQPEPGESSVFEAPPDTSLSASGVRARVALFSKMKTIQTREIADKLRKRHRLEVVRVEQIGSQSSASSGARTSRDIDLSGCDAVLVLHEYASHSEVNAVREVAKRQSVLCFNLSRKASAWGEQLRVLFSTMTKRRSQQSYYERTGNGSVKIGELRPDKLAVSDADLPLMLATVRTMREAGKDWPEIAPAVANYWRRGVVPTPSAVKQMVYTSERRAACPEWWPAWFEGQRRRARSGAAVRHVDPSTVAAPSRERESLIDMGPKAAFPPLTLATPAAPAERPAERAPNATDPELVALYEEDNAKLTTRVRNLSDLVETYRRRVEVAERRLTDANLPPTGTLSVGVVVVIEAFASQVAYGAIDATQAFDLLVQYARKHTEGT